MLYRSRRSPPCSSFACLSNRNIYFFSIYFPRLLHFPCTKEEELAELQVLQQLDYLSTLLSDYKEKVVAASNSAVPPLDCGHPGEIKDVDTDWTLHKGEKSDTSNKGERIVGCSYKLPVC